MILVTGVSGQLGGAVFDMLAETSTDIVGGSRNPAGDPRVRRLDFDDPETLNFVGVDTVVLISAGYAEDDVVVARHEKVVFAAERDGVGHIVYTSVASAGDHLAFALAHRWTERRIQGSTLSWTILRNGLYAELFGALLTPTDGVMTAPFQAGALAAVARSDLAEAAAIVARSPEKHSGRTYDLVGTRATTATEIAEELGVPYAPESFDDLRPVSTPVGSCHSSQACCSRSTQPSQTAFWTQLPTTSNAYLAESHRTPFAPRQKPHSERFLRRTRSTNLACPP